MAMPSRDENHTAITRSDLLLVLDQLDLGVTEKRERWALHDLLLRIGRTISADGVAQVYLRAIDQRVLDDLTLGSKVRRVWKRGNVDGKLTLFTLTPEFERTLADRVLNARAQREARLDHAAAKSKTLRVKKTS